ncbi:hypothetical protein ACFC26_30890 [Kitasatospora purpeofusca]|uniref:hypothetical protein n=1 Tax=Kitasatospora purpeofusca TaxID=67352 RepID=UPI0035DD50E4
MMELFLRLRDQVRTDAGENLTRYLDGLTQWVRGYLDWSSLTPRCSNPHTPNDHRTTQPDFTITGATETEPSQPPGPLPIPTIAYWWDLLTDQD